jgi:hypothetical protein
MLPIHVRQRPVMEICNFVLRKCKRKCIKNDFYFIGPKISCISCLVETQATFGPGRAVIDVEATVSGGKSAAFPARQPDTR